MELVKLGQNTGYKSMLLVFEEMGVVYKMQPEVQTENHLCRHSNGF